MPSEIIPMMETCRRISVRFPSSRKILDPSDAVGLIAIASKTTPVSAISPFTVPLSNTDRLPEVGEWRVGRLSQPENVVLAREDDFKPSLSALHESAKLQQHIKVPIRVSSHELVCLIEHQQYRSFWIFSKP